MAPPERDNPELDSTGSLSILNYFEPKKSRFWQYAKIGSNSSESAQITHPSRGGIFLFEQVLQRDHFLILSDII